MNCGCPCASPVPGRPAGECVRLARLLRHCWLGGAVLLLLGAPGSTLAIVNGSAVSAARYAADFPWAVALVGRGEAGGVCTAVLISPTWVLTAGHCTSKGNQVLIGHPERGMAHPAQAAEAVVHPGYDPRTGVNDIGLIRLQRPVAQAPVRLMSRAEAPVLLKERARAVIAGWGKRSPSLGFSEPLIVSDVELRNLQQEDGRFAFLDTASGPCGGDSGGPLLLARPDGTWVLAGIASRVVGNLCAQGGGISLYMNVALMRDFIDRHVRDLAQ